MTYELDRLFRSDRAPQGGDAEARAEAGRIIQTALGHTDVAADDRAYLVRLVAARTGLPPTDADRRVQQIISEIPRRGIESAPQRGDSLDLPLPPHWLPRQVPRGALLWPVGVTGIMISRLHCIFLAGDEVMHHRARWVWASSRQGRGFKNCSGFRFATDLGGLYGTGNHAAFGLGRTKASK